MSPDRWFLALALSVTWLAGAALGQNTVGGTIISNTATATFEDSNGVDRSTFSNTVETIVQTVYSFEVTPDDRTLVNPRTPTPVTDFAGYAETDGLNDASGAIGSVVTFTYTITNDTNNDAANPVNLSLSIVQDGADDFDLSNVVLEVFDGTNWVPYAPASGVNLTAQGQQILVRVRGEIPAGVDGNDVALIDLVASNNSAVAAGQTGPNVSFESNNVARTTVAEIPIIGVAKDVASVTNNGNGTYTVAYLMTVQNYGNVPLSGVQVVEDLTDVFAAGTFVVGGVVASGTLAANGAFDGDADQNLLVAGSSTLLLGATETVTLRVTVTPGANLGPYTNQVTASGSSPRGVPVSDLSTRGTDPDQNGVVVANDGDGDPRNTDSLTPVTFTENPVIGLAKAATAGVAAPAGFPGQFETTITLTLRNYGDVELRSVQVTDVLTTTFPLPASYVVTAAPVATVTVPGSGGTNALTGNAAFNGNTVTSLLTAGNTLAAGATATITFTVRFDPGGRTGPFDNTAATTATSPAGTEVADASVNGTDPDPDGDGPGNNASPTPITFTEDPIIGLAKNLDSVVDAPGAPGQFDVTFTFTVRNYGNVDLNDVQIVDNLAATFGAPAAIVSVGTPTSATLAVNAGFTGVALNTGLLAATGNTLRPAESGTVTVTVRIDPNGVTSFTNAANASGTSPGGVGATDTSHSGLNPAPGIGTDPRDFNDTTPIVIPEAPLLGVAKNLEGFVNNGDGSYRVTYLVTVQNYGNVPLSAVQVTENFAATFAGATFTGGAVTATTGGLTANVGFTGSAPNTALLTGANTLVVGATGTITVVVTVTPGSNLGPYNNQVSAGATSPGGTPGNVTDLSANGTDPDVNGDGNPNNDASVTPVTFTEAPVLGVAKVATPGVNAPGFPGEFLTTITLTLRNYGDVELRNVQVTDVLTATFPAPVTYVVTSAPSSATLTGAGAAFDGTLGAGANVLAGTDTLAAGATATVSFTVRFNPNGATGPFDNTAVASGTSPAGTTVSDDSHEGTDPAPGGGNNPGDFDDPTPITFTETPLIGVAKDGTVTDFGPAGVGPFTIQIDFTLRNYGNVALANVTLTDNLDAAFGIGRYTVTAGPSVQSVSAGSVINVNPGFNGAAVTAIIATGSGSSLAIGGEAVVRIEVVIDTAGTYSNQATGTGTGPGGGTNTDRSTDGTDPDPDGNGNPNDNQVPTTWSVDELALAKTARTCTNANCAPGTVTDATGATVAPGQYLEYTLVGTATGDLTDVVVTDAIPADTFYVLGSISAGGECSTDGGASYVACPVVFSGPYDNANNTVTHVRWTQATLLNGAELTLRFVVRVR